MQVVSGPMGRERVHFEAPSADRLENEMTVFLDWFGASNGIDPVLKAGVAHFWFVTIHPFEDGDGRIGRAIADMALARAEGTADRFCSMSAQIEAERKQYYLHLEQKPTGRGGYYLVAGMVPELSGTGRCRIGDGTRRCFAEGKDLGADQRRAGKR